VLMAVHRTSERRSLGAKLDDRSSSL